MIKVDGNSSDIHLRVRMRVYVAVCVSMDND